MRKMMISCDRCGRPIEGNPVQILPQYVSRENGKYCLDEQNKIKSCVKELVDKDFCEDCAILIGRFALNVNAIGEPIGQDSEEIQENTDLSEKSDGLGGAVQRQHLKQSGADPGLIPER